MRKTLWTAVYIVAVVLTTAAGAQNFDWRVFTEPFI